MKAARIRTISITIPVDANGKHTGGGAISVQEGEHVVPHLCWDEALGQVVNLLHPALGTPKYSPGNPDELVRRLERHAS